MAAKTGGTTKSKFNPKEVATRHFRAMEKESEVGAACTREQWRDVIDEMVSLCESAGNCLDDEDAAAEADEEAHRK